MLRLLQTAAKFKAQVQPQLILLQKTLITVEGLSRQIYPDVDFFHIARESVESWIKRRSGIRGFIREIRKHAPRLATQLPALPELTFYNLQMALKEKNKFSDEKPIHSKKSFWSSLGASSLIGGIVLSVVLLIYPVEASTLSEFYHSLLLLFSASLGIFGIGCLFYCSRNY